MGLEFAGATDVGRKRDHNEDALLLLPEHNVAVVCDGMGGHEAGEVASGIGVETVKRFFEIAGDPDATWPFRYDRTKDEGTNLLVVAAQWANQRIREAADPGAKAPGKRGMGMADDTEVDVSAWDLEAGDVCLVCCDGRTGMVADERIAEILAQEAQLQKACQRLVDEANENGGVDNITVALVRYIQ